MNQRLLAASILLALASTAQAGELIRAKSPIQGQYIVVFKPDSLAAPTGIARNGALESAAENATVDLAAKHGVGVDRVFRSALQGFVARGNEASMVRLMKDPRVAFVEEDGMAYPTATQSGATWGLDRIDQRDRPLNGTYIYDFVGSAVRAYVIDSGILASHNDFGGRVLSGYSAIADGRGSSDCNGHGTHVAGTIGGATWGVAKSVRLVPVRVFGCTGGSANSTIIAGVDWVRANAVKPAVANMSLGGPISSATDTAVNNLSNSGVTVVVAAGNDNADACNFSPARAAGAITVGSTTNTDVRSSFSNFGGCLDIFAPGSSIMSTWYTSNTATNTISGTSMASPHVAGAAVLILAADNAATPATVRSRLDTKASLNKLTSINTGSPNKLLYSR